MTLPSLNIVGQIRVWLQYLHCNIVGQIRVRLHYLNYNIVGQIRIRFITFITT